jgi:hypothetical protein
MMTSDKAEFKPQLGGRSDVVAILSLDIKRSLQEDELS